MSRRKHAEEEEPTPPAQDVEGAAPPEAPPAPAPSPEVPAASATPAFAAELELAEQKEKYLRLAAEYDNYRKRSAKERLDVGSRAQAEIVSRLVDAIDDLGRFAHIDPATTDPM